MSSHITMCPYCRNLFDVEVGDKFQSGEIKEKIGGNNFRELARELNKMAEQEENHNGN